jgi:hypothetical protein
VGPAPDATVPAPTVLPSPVTTAPVVTVPPLANPTTTVPAPGSTVAADGLSVTDGRRTLAVSQAAALDPARQDVTVRGAGFDATRGIYVSLCAIPADGSAPSPCRTGSPAANRWVSSNPPGYGVGVATPFGADGSFEVELTIEPVVDTATDCRTVACAVVTRADDTAAPDDRSLDLAIPVSFGAAPTGTVVPTAVAPDDVVPDEAESASSVTVDDSSSGGPVVAVAAVAVALALVAGALVVTRRRSASGPSAIAATTIPPDATGPEHRSDPPAGSAP